MSHLRTNASYGGAASLGHGAGYQYSHDSPEGWVDQQYLPEARIYYEPVDRGHEAQIKQRLDQLRQARKKTGETPVDKDAAASD